MQARRAPAARRYKATFWLGVVLVELAKRHRRHKRSCDGRGEGSEGGTGVGHWLSAFISFPSVFGWQAVVCWCFNLQSVLLFMPARLQSSDSEMPRCSASFSISAVSITILPRCKIVVDCVAYLWQRLHDFDGEVKHFVKGACVMNKEVKEEAKAVEKPKASEKPKNVYQAIARVQAALAKEGISKDRTAKTGGEGGFKFRGIDDIYNSLAGLLAENELCILPRVLKRDVTERKSAKGNALFYVVVDVEYDFVFAGDGSKHTLRVCGEAMDTGDKATNKAMSVAYKYACLQAFCIPTEGDNDPDATVHGDIQPKEPASVFDSDDARKMFVATFLGAVEDAKSTADLKDRKAIDQARLTAMSNSKNAADAEGYKKILDAYNPKFTALKQQEVAKQKPAVTVDAAKAASTLGDDDIPF